MVTRWSWLPIATHQSSFRHQGQFYPSRLPRWFFPSGCASSTGCCRIPAEARELWVNITGFEKFNKCGIIWEKFVACTALFISGQSGARGDFFHDFSILIRMYSRLRLIRHTDNSALCLIRTISLDTLHWLPMLKCTLNSAPRLIRTKIWILRVTN